MMTRNTRMFKLVSRLDSFDGPTNSLQNTTVFITPPKMNEYPLKRDHFKRNMENSLPTRIFQRFQEISIVFKLVSRLDWLDGPTNYQAFKNTVFPIKNSCQAKYPPAPPFFCIHLLICGMVVQQR